MLYSSVKLSMIYPGLEIKIVICYFQVFHGRGNPVTPVSLPLCKYSYFPMQNAVSNSRRMLEYTVFVIQYENISGKPTNL